MSHHQASRTVTVINPHGLHLRPLELFVRTASEFSSTIALCKGEQRADGKSIIDILSLAVEQGTEVTVHAEGDDSEAAVEALAELLQRNFDDDAANGNSAANDHPASS